MGRYSRRRNESANSVISMAWLASRFRNVCFVLLVGQYTSSNSTRSARPRPIICSRGLAPKLEPEETCRWIVREFGPAVLEAGKHLMVLSVGALVGVLDDWARRAEKHGCRILVPSGAIAGLDGVKGAREGVITAVTMETRKPPRGLAGAPYILEHRIDLDAITAETLIFEGPAAEAVRAFPANVNVVAALSLAGIGPERTRIKLYAVPGQARNQHRITIEGEFGTLRIEVENVPSENPRTGRLSYLSAIAMLREMGSSSATVCAESSNVGAVATYRAAGFLAGPEVADWRRDV